MREFTDKERTALDALALASRMVARLPMVHPADQAEFVHHMHACQNIVLARPATEAEGRRR